ncbi:hypothetical protein CMK12_13360 [Candidatus Poribacteria bacterium]|nr:hypothetical protein [Candidatus Poribacteria bacterium]
MFLCHHDGMCAFGDLISSSNDQFLDHLLPVSQQINLVYDPISGAEIIGRRISTVGQIYFESGVIHIPNEISSL